MNEHHIETPKTARFFTLGELNSQTQHVWIVCHGYAQLANHFLNWFTALDSSERFIIAPEALHRFYWKGFDGKVVASWMTKEDRLNDIKDYTTFLDNVYRHFSFHSINPSVKVHVLGFSQGGATVCRWVTQTAYKIDTLSLWAGAFPEDIDYFQKRAIFNQLNLHIIIGDDDPFYAEERVEKQMSLLQEKAIQYTLIRFKGKHKVLPEPLLELARSIEL